MIIYKLYINVVKIAMREAPGFASEDGIAT
jgi:hypothetical protein